MITLWNSLNTNSWEIDKHYEEFFGSLVTETKTCTFCGINQLPNPDAYRADYDHLAFKGDYPIAAINTKNIAPSCSECNQKYKKGKDVFYTDDTLTKRQPFNYPFANSIPVEVTFTGTVFPNTDPANDKGTWIIDFKPTNDLVNSWNNVYKIRERYIMDVLAVDYNIWIGEFVHELKGQGVNTVPELKKQFIKHFRRYGKNKLQKRYLVKSSLFKHFYKCNDNALYDQLIKQIN